MKKYRNQLLYFGVCSIVFGCHFSDKIPVWGTILFYVAGGLMLLIYDNMVKGQD